MGQIAWWIFDFVFCKSRSPLVLLHCSPKCGGTLLGSNSMRNAIAEATGMRQGSLASAFLMLRGYFNAKKKTNK